jgi:hypothetical protein
MATALIPGTGTTHTGHKVFGPNGNLVKDFGTTTATPYGLATQDVAEGLTQNSWDQKLEILSTENDILDFSIGDTEGNYYDGKITLPNSIIMTLTAGAANAVHTFPVANPLVGRPLAGTADLLGHEKGQSQRYINCFYNEVKDGVAVTKYGVAYNYDNAFNLYEQATPQLTKYWGETKGRMKRQCLVEQFNEEIFVNNPVTLPFSDTHYNPNWLPFGDATDAQVWSGFVPGGTPTPATPTTSVDGDGMPLYTPVKADFMDNIATALIEGAGTGVIDITYFDKISFYASERLIERIDGKYYVMVPKPVWYEYTKLNKDWGTYFQKVSTFEGGTNRYDGEMYEYRDLVICPDNRYVSMAITGKVGDAANDTALAAAITYKEPGNEDNRVKTPYDGTIGGDTTVTGADFMLGAVLGKSAVIERKEKELHYKYDVQNYQQNEGIGTFMEVGYNLRVIRTDAHDAGSGYPTNAENRGSMILAFPNTIVG